MTRNIEQKLRQYRLSKQQQENAGPSGLSKLSRSTQEAIGYCAGLLGLNKQSSSQDQPDSLNEDASTPKSEIPSLPASASDKSRVKSRVPRKSQVVAEEDLITSNIRQTRDVPQAAYSALDWIVLSLQSAVWLLLFTIFIQLEFGAVFFVLSMFYLMWRNLRSDRRKPHEPSAYSVFNPNCEAIDGTLQPEQFEREIRRGF